MFGSLGRTCVKVARVRRERRPAFSAIPSDAFVPQRQRNVGKLARPRATCHGRLDAFGQPSLVKILKRSGAYTRPRGGPFEQTFQIMVVILVPAPDGNLFLGALQLPSDVAVFSAGAGFQGQSAVGRQLSLGAKNDAAPGSEPRPGPSGWVRRRESAGAWQ